MRTAFVYVIGITANPVKVGIARDPNERLSNLQIGCPDELTLHHTIRLPAGSVQEVETATHQALKEHHRRGEWFNVDADHAFHTVTEIAVPIVARRAREISGRRIEAVEWLIAQKRVSEWAREAVQEYRYDLHRLGGVDGVNAVHDLIQERAGKEALLTFKRTIGAETGDRILLGRDPKALSSYNAALAKALNVVAEKISGARECMLLDEIEKFVA